jgi:hypothetical protein
MSEFQQRVEEEATRLERQQAESAALQKERDAALSDALALQDSFFGEAREAAALLVARGVAPSVTKRKLHFRSKERLFGGRRLVLDHEAHIFGWILEEKTHIGSDPWDHRKWVTGVLFDDGGALYGFIDDQIKDRLETYDDLIRELGFPTQVHSPEEVTGRVDRLRNLLTTRTAQLLAR